MNYFGIDPGTRSSGVVRIGEDGAVQYSCSAEPNNDVRRMAELGGSIVVIEACRLYMGVGKDVEMTIRWSGRFWECAFRAGNEPVWVYPSERRAHWGVRKDSEQRVALLDHWGGKEAAVGRKKSPGPLFGVASHAWSALALAEMVRRGWKSTNN